MSIFDLLFIVLFLASAGVLIVAAVAAIRGKGKQATRILLYWNIGAVVYLGIGFLSHYFLPVRVLSIGEDQCSDDWCIAVSKVDRDSSSYALTLRISSRARRVAQRENGLVVYLTDDAGNRYDPVPDPSAVPLNVKLEPQESVTTTRVFKISPGARDLRFVVGHQGGFQMGWLIIGRSPFQKTVVQLP